MVKLWFAESKESIAPEDWELLEYHGVDQASNKVVISAGYCPTEVVSRTKRGLLAELGAGEWMIGQITCDADDVAHWICDDGTPRCVAIKWRAMVTMESRHDEP